MSMGRCFVEAVVSHNLKGYELKERIGAGGFGAVYRAYQSTVGREVAVKIILPGLANQPDFIRRFEGEAQIVARLEHPHITPLYDYWRDPDGAYLVMRWLKGGSLRDVLEQGAFDLRSAALLLDQIAGALSLAHRNNVIHRDIKPGNILLDEDGNAYLTDFGIAKDLNLPGNNTQPDAIVGSLDYISPEQARSEPITRRTDIYSLGVTLFEVITGHHPFENLSPIERLYKHINDPLPEISTLNATVNAAVNRVIQKATTKNPEHRYVDALAFAADFREAVGLNRVPTAVELLTQREQETLQLIIDGLSNKEIAARLTVTLSTVKWHVNQIYSKLGVRSRVQAMVRARELNLLTKSSDSLSVVPIATEDFQPENPYKGLRAFQSADNQDFFGREKVTAKLVKRLEEAHEFARFLAVVGPSGSGKSSLVKAGLIPALWRGELPNSEKWFVVELLPGAHLLDELEVALLRVAANHAGSLKDQLARDRRGLIRAAQLILPADGSELVLVIDQFEEVFTLLQDEAERVQFLDLLYAAVTEPRSRVRIILTLRADFYDRPLHYPEFGELVRSRLETIMPLSAEELERAITSPAKRAGVTFEAGLAAGIIADVNYQPGALPLLQYALTELFEQRQGRSLTRDAYQAIGGTVGALAKRADEIYLDLDESGQEAARQMFLRLVTLGEGTEDTRRRVARSELLALAPDSDVMDDVLDTYAEYRLLSLDNDPSSRAPTVEVAHEALLREWERLRGWLKESRDEIKLQRQLDLMATEWQKAKRDASFLARGSRLTQFESWAKDTQLALTGAEHAYLDASIAQRALEEKAETERKAREQVLEQRSVRFLRALVAVMFVALIGAVGLTGVAVNQSQIAQRSAAEAQNIALVSGSQAALANGNTDRAIALAMEAVTIDPSSSRAQVALSEAAYAPGTIRIFEGHTAEVNWVEFSPDGLTALSASFDGTLILWDIQTGSPIRHFEGHTAEADTITFMPDGLSAISGSYDTTMIQWDIQTGEILRRFEGQPDEIWAVAISPDGLTVASGGSGTNMLQWDIQTGEILRRFEGHTEGIESIAFSADGSKLVSASEDSTVILWDAATGQIIHRFEGHTSFTYSAVFSPDNTMILSGSDDGNMILWDVETGQIVRTFYGGGTTIHDVAFSPDGHSILSGGVAGVVLWNTETGQPHNYLTGHGGTVKSVAFNPNGRTGVSAAVDGTLRLWDLENGQIIRRFNANGLWLSAMALSPDGQKALSVWYIESLPNAIVLSDVNTGEEISRGSINAYITTVAFSPDGQTALLGVDHFDGTPSDVILWDVNTAEEIRRFIGHPAGLRRLGFFPDGRTAFSNDGQGITIIWDVETGAEIRRFTSEEAERLTAWFTPDGQTFVDIHADGDIVLWDVVTGAEIRRFEGHTLPPTNVTFSDDGQRAFSGGQDNTTILWDVASGTILHRFTDHSSQIPVVDMTTDGSLGIAGAADGTTLLWDLNTGELIRRYDDGVFQPIFLPDNRTALVTNLGNIELWRIDGTLDELLTWTRANRYIPELACDQRELYRLESLCETETTTP
jgi:WD40 repeat protein/serine/threonine protein kinase